jgi:hypothetical protein
MGFMEENHVLPVVRPREAKFDLCTEGQAWRKYLISGIDKNRCQNRKISIESILESILIINLKIVVQR